MTESDTDSDTLDRSKQQSLAHFHFSIRLLHHSFLYRAYLRHSCIIYTVSYLLSFNLFALLEKTTTNKNHSHHLTLTNRVSSISVLPFTFYRIVSQQTFRLCSTHSTDRLIDTANQSILLTSVDLSPSPTPPFHVSCLTCMPASPIRLSLFLSCTLVSLLKRHLHTCTL